MRKISPLKLSVIGLGIAINIIGAFIALNLRLPIYLDSIGTIMISGLLGPIYGAAAGILSSIVSGVTSDIYALYFSPVQILIGLISGIVFKKGLMKGFKMPLGVLVVTIFSSLAGSVIAAYLFNGVTSSGSSYLVVLLTKLGVNKVASVFIVQFLTDYADKFVAVFIVATIIKRIPLDIKQRILRS